MAVGRSTPSLLPFEILKIDQPMGVKPWIAAGSLVEALATLLVPNRRQDSGCDADDAG